jgi:hypothetical protein
MKPLSSSRASEDLISRELESLSLKLKFPTVTQIINWWEKLTQDKPFYTD